ncbi:hypothetical protein JOD82_001713 [Paenibacillus sp. 1182]|uniref:pilus assembly protein TadB n=1 Tax=Paenibacillus sp. 1182 TaxID=2806565 RepID=UPI001AE32C98|nr:pilus assembly protein TadB [Paenibacillus sp. 1182]MBP1308693.1 hypothetical protein [Paenibacillus sp. 1182]
MGIVQSAIQEAGNHLVNILFILLMGGSLYLLTKGLISQRKITGLFNLSKVVVKEKTKIKRFNPMLYKKLRQNLTLYYTFKSSKNRADLLYFIIIATEWGLLLAFVFSQKFLLAIIFPFLVHWFANKILNLMTINIHFYIEKELPLAIKHLIKSMTKMNDLKLVMLETSNTLQEPLRSYFLELSRKMVTENYEKSLMEFADELNDTWIYAFTFLLLSYKEQSKKADVIQNLSNLAEMMENENHLKEKRITERKATVILNSCLGVFAISGLILNLIFNKYAVEFFFNSFAGMLLLIVGVTAIMGTFIINLMLSKKTM